MSDYKFVDRPDLNRMTKSAGRYDISEDSTARSKVFLDFLFSNREMIKAYDRFLDQYDLSESRFIILMFLLQAPNKTLAPSEIVQKLGATKATVSKMLKVMENKEWVEKTPSTIDKRSVAIKLTKTGEKLINQFYPQNFKAVGQIMSELDESDLQSLTKIITKINKGIQKLSEEMENN